MPLAADIATLTPPPHVLFLHTTPDLAGAGSSWKTVVVRAGDTLWDIAVRHLTTPEALVAKNRLKGGGRLIFGGQKLLVPTGTPLRTVTPAPTPARPTSSRPTASRPAQTLTGRTHVVRAGETMSGIARRYGLSLTKLLAANRLRNAGLIFVGQKITVPGAGSSAPSRPASVAKPSPVASAVETSRRTLAGRSAPSRTATAALIRATALRHGVDLRLALAVGWLESGWYQRAVSYTDAVGVMQIMPTSGTWASQLAGRSLDRYDTADNITSGVLMLRALQRSADSREQAIAAYYQGLSSVRSRGLYTDTKAYVAKVLAIYARM